jgi:hypothetical protein
MKTFYNYLFCSVVFLSIAANSQNNLKYNGLLLEKNSEYTATNLKDSVKSVFFHYTKIKETLTQEEKNWVQSYNDVGIYRYSEFNKLGQRTIYLNCGKSFFDDSLNFECADKYIFDDKDWAEKSKYKTALKHYYPVSNHNLLIKLNQTEVPKKEQTVVKDKVWQEYNGDIYIYIYIYIIN